MRKIEVVKKEFLKVLHKNLDARPKDLEELQEEGWKISSHDKYTLDIPKVSLETFKVDYPEIEIVYPAKGSYLHVHPYVYCSTLERTIQE